MAHRVGRIGVLAVGLLAVQLSLAPEIAMPDAAASASAAPSSGGASSSASPIPFALGAPPLLSPNRDVIVLMGAGNVTPSAILLAAMANRLGAYRLVNSSRVVVEPGWAVGDFVASCKADPTVAGALVTVLIAATSAQQEEFLYRRSSVNLYGQAVWIACAAPKPKVASQKNAEFGDIAYIALCVRNAVRHLTSATVAQSVLKACTLSTPAPEELGSPVIGWVSPVAYGSDPKFLKEPLNWLALALAGVSIYELFRPSITTNSGSTTIYPTAAPIPRGGELSSVTSADSTTSNPSSGLASLISGIYAQDFANSAAAVSLPIADEQNWDAANGMVTNIVTAMNCSLSTPAPKATAPPIYTFPAYQRGNASYPRHNKTLSSAPFCAPS